MSSQALTRQQIKTVEDVQRRAVQIIAGNIPYADACEPMGISSLADRRSDLCSKLFAHISNDELHVLCYLLPTKRDTELINRLRSAAVFPPMRVWTSRFKNSFIPFSVAKLSSS